MNYWQTQAVWAVACKISPDWEPAIEKLKARTLHLRSRGHTLAGLEETVSTRRWIDLHRMTPSEIRLLIGDFQRQGNNTEQHRIYLSRAILKGMHSAGKAFAQELWTRLVVDAMFGYGDVVEDVEADRMIFVVNALTAFGKIETWSWSVIGLHFELASAWPADTASFFLKLAERYAGCLEPSLEIPGRDVLRELEIVNIAEGGLAEDRPSFSELAAHQAPSIDEAALRSLPAYDLLSSAWDRFLGQLHLRQGAWLIGQVTRDMCNDPDAICRPWDFDKQAHELTLRLARAKKQARLPASAAPTRAALPDVPPSWPDEADEARCLFWGPASVTYGWLMFQHDAEQHANFDAFNGQQNGLIGALEPGVLTLNTALHTGEVHLSAWQADVEPAMPHEAWAEVVEVSLVVPAGAELHVENLDAEFWEALDLAPGTYRVRVAAGRYGLATEGEDRDAYDEPVERYALIFWPDTEWRPDAVLRQRHPALIAQHRRAQAGGF